MKQLVLIRHAKTESIYNANSDFERQLEQRGIDDAKQIAQDLLNNDYTPQLIICSNAVRALQTAQTMAETIDYTISHIQQERFIYDGYTTGEFLDFIGKIDNQINSIWIIGHNPDIAMLATKLTNDDFDHYPTSAAAVISFDANKWTDVAARSGKTIHFITPKQIK